MLSNKAILKILVAILLASSSFSSPAESTEQSIFGNNNNIINNNSGRIILNSYPEEMIKSKEISDQLNICESGYDYDACEDAIKTYISFYDKRVTDKKTRIYLFVNALFGLNQNDAARRDHIELNDAGKAVAALIKTDNDFFKNAMKYANVQCGDTDVTPFILGAGIRFKLKVHSDFFLNNPFDSSSGLTSSEENSEEAIVKFRGFKADSLESDVTPHIIQIDGRDIQDDPRVSKVAANIFLSSTQKVAKIINNVCSHSKINNDPKIEISDEALKILGLPKE